MGNNSSSSHQYCASNGSPSHEIGRGWTQSFPRELARHHPQQPGHKVLPEPPNQRLRATNNGSIIHNGGTISGRRPPALTLPHDLNKVRIRSGFSSRVDDVAMAMPCVTYRHTAIRRACEITGKFFCVKLSLLQTEQMRTLLWQLFVGTSLAIIVE